MKKFFILLSLLPFLAFGAFDHSEDVRVNTVRLFAWSDFDVSPTSLNAPSYNVYSSDELYSVFSNGRWGFKINLKRTTASGYNFSLNIPSHISTFTNGLGSIGYCVRGSTNGVSCSMSPLLFPSVSALYQSAATLFSLGYRGSGVQWFQSSGTTSNFCVNVDYPVLVSDVLCSTNTVFRQVLLSHLSTIQAAVVSIDSGVSALSPLLEYISSINSSIQSNTLSISVSSLGIVSNTSVIADNSSNISSALTNGVSSVSPLYLRCRDFLASGSDWWDFLSDYDGDNIPPVFHWASNLGDSQVRNFISDLLSYSPDPPLLLQQLVEGSPTWLNKSLSAYFSDYDENGNSASRGPMEYYETPSIVFRQLGKDQTFDVVDALIGDYDVPSRSKSVNTRTSIKSQLKSWRDEARQQLNDWKVDLSRQLEDWKHSDETGYLNVRESIRNNLESPRGDGTTNCTPFYAYQTNVVTRIVTNSVVQTGNGISTNIVEQSKATRDFLEEKFNDGIDVRIVFPLYQRDNEMINVHDNQLEEFLLEWVHFSHDVSDSLSALVGGSDTPSITNIVDLSSLTNLIDAITNRNSYLLLDHYESYISNGVYSSSVSAFFEDFPNVHSNLLRYGLSDDNFWTLFGANLLYQSGLIGNLLDDMALVRRFADDHIEGGFTEGIRRIVDKFPSQTQIGDFLNSASNNLSTVDQSSSNLFSVLSVVTNSAYSAFRPFDGVFEAPTSDLVFFKLGNEKYVTIPVKDQLQVWSLIRTGIAFALVAVNVLLFPRFVLMIVTLFSRLSSRFVNFVPTDKM